MQLSEAMSKAFRDEPAWVYLLPDGARRLRLLPSFFNILLRYSQRYGAVYTTTDSEGAACWLTPGNTTPLLHRLIRIGIREARPGIDLGWAGFRRYMAMERCSETLHQQSVTGDHWYLWALGVDPVYQKQGMGGMLMQPVFERADANRLPCYLETSNELNITFYQKHGFTVVNEGTVPKSDLHVWAMMRKPVLLNR
ncbi:MAG TPA: GNAT family N-acetyltransferase [Ktedonobacteraceae bacterium]|nr:GNAT family N-acetyltransferase [Ktedonobacteraceae bacterium]